MGAAYAHLLRLLCEAFFEPEAFRVGARIARGAYGAVHECALRQPLRRTPLKMTCAA